MLFFLIGIPILVIWIIYKIVKKRGEKFWMTKKFINGHHYQHKGTNDNKKSHCGTADLPEGAAEWEP